MNIFSKNPDKCTHILELLAINGANVNQKNYDNWTPLHSAVRKGQEKAIYAIIQLNKKLNKLKII
jgi:ankyrin repeat protein